MGDEMPRIDGANDESFARRRLWYICVLAHSMEVASIGRVIPTYSYAFLGSLLRVLKSASKILACDIMIHCLTQAPTNFVYVASVTSPCE